MRVPFSLEYFPPKTEEGVGRLHTTHLNFSRFMPDYCSVTYGAGGTTRHRTLQVVTQLQGSVPVAPHLSCIGDTRESLRRLLQHYQQLGIKRLIALRGDLPSGQVGLGELPYAVDLVKFIRSEFQEDFHIEVAAYPEVHPQAENAFTDLQHFILKVQAGAHSAITQYFYNADAYWNFCEQLQRHGCNVPIIPGIMPITNASNLLRFSDSCGAEIPRWLRRQLAAYADDQESIRRLGEEVVGRLCEQLLQQGAPALHFYTMNLFQPTASLLQHLGVQPQ